MRVQDLLRRKTKRIVCVVPGTRLMEAMGVMSRERVGTVLIMDGDELKGLISERDFVRIFTEHGVAAAELPVCDLIRRSVITCHEDATLHDLMILMSNNGIRHLPVVRDGTVIDMVSARDVLDAQKDVLLQLVKRQKQAYKLALAAKNQAETSDRHKTEFLQRVSHELRTPLNAVIGFGDMIAEEKLGPVGDNRYGEYAAEISRSGTRLLTIIDEILEMTRLALGKWEPKSEIVDLGKEIEKVSSSLNALAIEREISVNQDAPVGGRLITADRFMIEEMLTHIIGNAIKFGTAGSTVHTEVENDRNGVRIRVSDTGRGISAERLAFVTKPFCCAQDALTQNGEGIGLGLALTDAMMAAHGGSLSIESQLGEGTVVTLEFPQSRTELDVSTGTGGQERPQAKAS